MARGGRQRDTRAERERARLYEARKGYQRGLTRRRTRDNVIAGVGGGILILGVIAGQTAYFVAGPGAPAPVPSTTVSPSSSPGPVSPEPTVAPEPSISPSSSPAPSS